MPRHGHADGQEYDIWALPAPCTTLRSIMSPQQSSAAFHARECFRRAAGTAHPRAVGYATWLQNALLPATLDGPRGHLSHCWVIIW